MPGPRRVRVVGVVGRPPWWATGVALVVLVLVGADVLHHGLLSGLDHRIARLMVRWNIDGRTWPRRFTYVLTLFGQRATVLVVTIPTICYLSWVRGSIDPLARYAGALVLLTLAVYAVKEAVGRTAPPVDALHTANGGSFPSGHIANAVLVWGVLWVCAQDPVVPSLLRRTLGVIRLIAPWSVAIGMTLLDYHWITDFIAGSAIGIVLLSVVTTPMLTTPLADLDRRLTSRRSSR